MARRPGEVYPSDEARRKTKPAVRIHHSVVHHPRLAEVYGDNEMFATWTRLLLKASICHAGKTGNKVTLARSALCELTGRSSTANALRTLRSLCARVGYAMSEQGASVTVEIRNFARKQGFDPALRGDAAGVNPGTPAPSESESESEVDTGREPTTASPNPTAKSETTCLPEPTREREPSIRSTTGNGEAPGNDDDDEPEDPTRATPTRVVELVAARVPDLRLCVPGTEGLLERDLRARIREHPNLGEWEYLADRIERQREFLVLGEGRRHGPATLGWIVRDAATFAKVWRCAYEPDDVDARRRAHA